MKTSPDSPQRHPSPDPAGNELVDTVGFLVAVTLGISALYALVPDAIGNLQLLLMAH